MGKKMVMIPAKDLDLSEVKYELDDVEAPHLTGLGLKLFVGLVESPVIGPTIVSFLKRKNRMIENTVVPEEPMYRPEYPPQELEPAVVVLGEDGKSEDRVSLALKCLQEYDPSTTFSNADNSYPFRYWKIRDYAHAYRSGITTPLIVAEHVISVLEEFRDKKPREPLLISFDADIIRKQASASTKRFEEGNPKSIMDGIFMAVKDDIDLYPHPTNGGTTWFHEVRAVNEDGASVSKLRSCGVIFVGKANMHEMGIGTTGNNPNYGTTRNPHAPERYTGGSSSGPAAIVAAGICSAAIGTDGGGSVRIPASLCGVVGLKSTYARISTEGSLCCGTVEIIGPIASSVEDLMLVYSAILGASIANRISMHPSPPCVPNLLSYDHPSILGSLRMGKYSKWFNDVDSTEISDKCEEVLRLLSKTHGCEVEEIVVPELHEMRTAHLLSIGSEFFCALNPDCQDGKLTRCTYDTRISMALFKSFSAGDYVVAQHLRRRIMHHFMEIFKKVDIIVTPTTGMTAPIIPPSALTDGESDMKVTGYLMKFITVANLLGLPAITVPVGYDKNGLPIGLQLLGRPWAEATLLRLASAVEELCPERKKPVQYFDVLRS